MQLKFYIIYIYKIYVLSVAAVPTGATPLISALKTIKNPTEALRNVYNLVLLLISEIERKWPSSAERYVSFLFLSLSSFVT
jgi:hypothetical protein